MFLEVNNFFNFYDAHNARSVSAIRQGIMKENNEIPHFVPVENAESCRSFISKSGACEQSLPSTISANFAEEKQKNDF